MSRPHVWLTSACLVAALAAFGVLTLALAPPASAHARLVATTPADDELLDTPPDAVELEFDEPVDTGEGAVRVLGPEGERVGGDEIDSTRDGAVLDVPIDAPDRGTYTVAWRVTSQDGHTLTGSFVFHVGTRTGAVALDEDTGGTTVDVVGGVGRWLGFAGTLVAVGAAALALLNGRNEPAAAARLRPLAVAGATAAALGVLLALAATLAESSGRSVVSAFGLIPDQALDSRTGELALLRLGICVLVAVVGLVAPLWRWSPAPVAAVGAGSLVVASLAGHAWTAPARALAVVTDSLHLGAVSVWIGGLVALLVALPVAEHRPRFTSRFSQLALAMVPVVVVTGAVSGYQQVRTLDGLTSTGYGQLLLVKVAGFVVLVGLGALNRARLIGLVERTIVPLTQSLRAEVAVAALVLAVTAVLIHEPPARATTVADGPFETTVHNDEGALQATVDPARAGSNDIHLFFNDHAGAELPVDAVAATAATGDVPPRRLTVTPITPNHVTVTGASLPTPGTWTIEVTAVREGQPLVFTFEVPVT